MLAPSQVSIARQSGHADFMIVIRTPDGSRHEQVDPTIPIKASADNGR
jgi:hypothetical protein